MDSVRAAWLRALIEVSGPERDWVNARQVAAELTRMRGTGARVSSHAAGANLRRLRTDGYVEARPADGWSWWRPTQAGAAVSTAESSGP